MPIISVITKRVKTPVAGRWAIMLMSRNDLRALQMTDRERPGIVGSTLTKWRTLGWTVSVEHASIIELVSIAL